MNREAGAVVVLITVSSEEETAKIARRLIERRKAACVNIVSKVQSLFWWQGKQDSAGEVLLLVKTRASLLPQVITLVKEIHSYTVPEIIALPIIGGNEDYLKWIVEETRED